MYRQILGMRQMQDGSANEICRVMGWGWPRVHLLQRICVVGPIVGKTDRNRSSGNAAEVRGMRRWK